MIQPIVDLPRICLVGDDAVVRDAMELLLRHSGLDVTVFESSTAALRRLLDAAEPRFDCLVCDLQMAGTSGIDLIEAAVMACQRLAVVAIAGPRDALLAQLARRLGVRHILDMPFDGDELLAAVRAARAAPLEF